MEPTRLQMLIAAVDQNETTLAAEMNIECDAILVNQCREDSCSSYNYGGHLVKCFCSKSRGVGLSRNTALLYAEGEILLFSDEDIRYRKGYAEEVVAEFDKHPEADAILFNVQQSQGRETYKNLIYRRVRTYNSGRYPAYAIAIRKDKLRKVNVTYSLLFGGGAKYSNGEDSLFLRDLLRKGVRIYQSPVEIGRELERDSTWFKGYTEKFFKDRGVLYHYLYGHLAKAMALQFLLRHRKTMCEEISVGKAYGLMREGIREAKS